MTQEEITAALLAGAQSAGGQYITVLREHLLIALGVEPVQATTETTSDAEG